nr:pra1 family protein b4 [Quercus suber]
MSSTTSPPILPISNTSSTTTTTAQSSQPPIATPAFRNFLSNITESVRNNLAQRRPWSELVDRSAFSKPESFSDATLRVRKNYSYFRINYLTVIGLVLAFSLLSNPISLLVLLGLLSAWLFLYLFRPSDQPLVLFGRAFSDRETLGFRKICFSMNKKMSPPDFSPSLAAPPPTPQSPLLQQLLPSPHASETTHLLKG